MNDQIISRESIALDADAAAQRFIATGVDRVTPQGFTEVPYGYGRRWLHESRRAWIQLYPETCARREFYQAYVSVGNVPAGRDPETCDNRRMGNGDHGFATLGDAADAVRVTIPGEGA